ncbi:hypothetical protein F4808DRAFT_405488 [Astrocystis sublimbata]|nr:hypothetical protein F4808DRAFT_405488 [Astrocystis sublimbata]
MAFTIATLAACTPFAANWDKVSYPNYKCINISSFYTAQAVIGAVLDFAILLLPVPFVWSLRLPTRKKIGLSLLFSIGVLICGISLARLVYNTRQDYQFAHFTEYAGIVFLLGSLELNLFIINACLPTFPSLAHPISEWTRSMSNSTNRSWKRLITGFSTKSDVTKPGQAQTSSSFVKLDESDASHLEPVFNGADLESAKIQRQHDKLYPLNVTMGTQFSTEGDQDWAFQNTESRTRITSTEGGQIPDIIEMSTMGTANEPQNSINVTRGWTVDKA